MRKQTLFITSIVLLAIILYSFKTPLIDGANKNLNTNLDEKIERKVDSVLALMRLNEKIGQLVQYCGKWNSTGPSASNADKHKLNKLKNGEVGSMLNITSVASIRETQKMVMDHSRLKIPLIFGYDVIRVYNKGEICLFANSIYVSNSDENIGDNPIIGLKWDQLL